MWENVVAQATCEEQALLHKTAERLRVQRAAGLSALRFDGQNVIAHTTLWHLTNGWYELGTVWVERTRRGRGLSADLYRDLFHDHPERNILSTTTNPAALRIGAKVGMRCVRFSALPRIVWTETCCCPYATTGSADNVASCRLRETRCFAQVTEETWLRLDRPAEIDFLALL